MAKSSWWVVAVVIGLLAALAGPAAADTRIAVGVSFLFNNHAYVPVRPTCGYLGANLAYDPYRSSAAIVYQNRNLTLVVGTRSAFYNSAPVLLPAPVVVVRDQLCCPASAFDDYLGVPTRWERRRAYFEGPRGWVYYDVDPYTPPYALGVFASYGYPPVYYAPRSFVYGGALYLPLRDIGDLIGAAILLDLLGNRGVVTYGGVQTVLYVGSPRCYYGSRLIVLPGPPILVGSVLYVPQRLVTDYWRVPVRRSGRAWLVDGGWGDRSYALAAGPPARVYRSLTATPPLRVAARAAGARNVRLPGVASRNRGGRAVRPGGPHTGFPAVAARRPRAPVARPQQPRGRGPAARPQQPRGRGQGAPSARPQQQRGRGQGGPSARPQQPRGRGQGGPSAQQQRGRGQGGPRARPQQQGQGGGGGRGRGQGGGQGRGRRG